MQGSGLFRIKSLCFKSCFLVCLGLSKLLRKCDAFGLLFSELSKIRFALQGLPIDQLSSLTKCVFPFMFLSLLVYYFLLIVWFGWLQSQLQIVKLRNQACWDSGFCDTSVRVTHESLVYRVPSDETCTTITTTYER